MRINARWRPFRAVAMFRPISVLGTKPKFVRHRNASAIPREVDIQKVIFAMADLMSGLAEPVLTDDQIPGSHERS